MEHDLICRSSFNYDVFALIGCVFMCVCIMETQARGLLRPKVSVTVAVLLT